jgi:hypothetical protein
MILVPRLCLGTHFLAGSAWCEIAQGAARQSLATVRAQAEPGHEDLYAARRFSSPIGVTFNVERTA